MLASIVPDGTLERTRKSSMIAHVEPVAAKSAAPTYELKIVLLGAKPLIWRRLQVPGNANLGWLHAVVQTAMGWTNSHLHHFLTPEARYSDPRSIEDSGFGDEPDRDEMKALLSEVAPRKGVRFGYEYDFGDSWEHEITVERILPPGSGSATAAVCLDGARACPPEDCGGIWGYVNLLDVLKNPKHPEHKGMKEWIGGTFDAEAFDRAVINFWLGKLKWPRVTEAQLRKVLMGRDNYTEG
jgi:pRiA4b ORF-3-like protein